MSKTEDFIKLYMKNVLDKKMSNPEIKEIIFNIPYDENDLSIEEIKKIVKDNYKNIHSVELLNENVYFKMSI